MLLEAPSQDLTPLALGHLRGRGGLRAMSHARVLYLLRQLGPNPLPLGDERRACGVDQLSVHERMLPR